jgi:hypothetical protein
VPATTEAARLYPTSREPRHRCPTEERILVNAKQLVRSIIGLVILVQNAESRDEQGLSQSAENAILLAGAVAVASVVIAAITVYVKSHMPK